MDYEKIAVSAVQTMKPADLSRFLVVCALVSDLYCPGYDPRQSPAKDANLARTAARYKVDTAKIVSSLRTELSRKESANQAKPTGKKNSEMP